MSLIDNITDGLKKQGIDSSKIEDAINKSTEMVNSISDTATSMLKEAQATLTKGENMLNATLDSISNSFPEATESFFGKITDNANSLTDIVSAVGKGTKEVNQQCPKQNTSRSDPHQR